MNWTTHTLAAIAELSLGKMLDQKKNRGEPRPYLANINVRWGGFELSDLREMRFEPHENDRYGLRTGDIVMCEGGEPGRCAWWRDEVPGVMLQKALHRIRARDGVDSRFLYYSLFLQGRSGLLEGLFTGSTIKHLPSEKLAKVTVRLPSVAIQRRIASMLGAYDDLIEVNRRRIAVLEEMARRLFEEWFVHFRFPGHGTQPSEGELPAGWKRVPIADAYDGLFDGPHATPPPAESGPVFLGISDVRENGCLDLTNVRHIAESDFAAWTKRVTPRSGDIVFSYEATLNRYAMIPSGFRGCLGRRMALIRASGAGIARYLFRYFFTDAWRRLVAANTLSGATVQRIPLTRFPTFPIVVPPSDLLLRHDAIAAPLSRQVEVLSDANVRLAASRDLLLPRLISGDLSVSAAERELEAVA